MSVLVCNRLIAAILGHSTLSTEAISRLMCIFNSVLRPFQDYFSSYETGKSVGGQKRENPEKNHLAHPLAELGLSHM